MGKGKIVEATTRKARAVRRSKLGSLASLTVKPTTLQRYTKALERFFSFLAWNKFSLAASYEQLDSHLCQFVEHLWEEGEWVCIRLFSRYAGPSATCSPSHSRGLALAQGLEST